MVFLALCLRLCLFPLRHLPSRCFVLSWRPRLAHVLLLPGDDCPAHRFLDEKITLGSQWSCAVASLRSLRSPVSSYRCTIRSVVTTASRFPFGDQAMAVTLLMPSAGCNIVFRCLSCILSYQEPVASAAPKNSRKMCTVQSHANAWESYGRAMGGMTLPKTGCKLIT